MKWVKFAMLITRILSRVIIEMEKRELIDAFYDEVEQNDKKTLQDAENIRVYFNLIDANELREPDPFSRD